VADVIGDPRLRRTLEIMGGVGDVVALVAFVQGGIGLWVWTGSVLAIVAGVLVVWLRWRQPVDVWLAGALAASIAGAAVFGYAIAAAVDDGDTDLAAREDDAGGGEASSWPTTTTTSSETATSQDTSGTPSTTASGSTTSTDMSTSSDSGEPADENSRPGGVPLTTLQSIDSDLDVREVTVDGRNHREAVAVSCGYETQFNLGRSYTRLTATVAVSDEVSGPQNTYRFMVLLDSADEPERTALVSLGDPEPIDVPLDNALRLRVAVDDFCDSGDVVLLDPMVYR
jgi:hypothetical protein